MEFVVQVIKKPKQNYRQANLQLLVFYPFICKS